jgi:hypothetical protein
MLNNKITAENAALLSCREFCAGRRIGLYIEVIAAEFQFDRKKLTVYIKKSGDVSVCKLVRKLYDAFKMRISVEEIPSIDFMKDIEAKYLNISHLDIPFDELFNYQTLPNTYSPPQLKLNDMTSEIARAITGDQQDQQTKNSSSTNANQSSDCSSSSGVKKLTKLHWQSPVLLAALHQYMPHNTSGSHGDVEDMYRNHAASNAAAQEQKEHKQKPQQKQQQQAHKIATVAAVRANQHPASYPTENHSVHYQHGQGYLSSPYHQGPGQGQIYGNGNGRYDQPHNPSHSYYSDVAPAVPGNPYIPKSSHFNYASPMEEVRVFYPPHVAPPMGSPNGNRELSHPFTAAPHVQDFELHSAPHVNSSSRSHPEVSRYSSRHPSAARQPILGTPQLVSPLLQHYVHHKISDPRFRHPIPERVQQFPSAALGQQAHQRYGTHSPAYYSPSDSDYEHSPALSSSSSSSTSHSSSSSSSPFPSSFSNLSISRS